MRKELIPLSFVAMLVLLAGLIWLVPTTIVRFWASFVLLWVLPGLAWLPLLNKCGLERAEERIIVALGLNFLISPIVALTLAYIPGQLTRETLLLTISVVILIPVLLYFYRQRTGGDRHRDIEQATTPAQRRTWWRSTWFWLLILLGLAATIRLINLDYAEFQGDEAAVLIKSARILVGEDSVLFQHKKGPAELLLNIAGWQLTGITNEWMARLAFSWASILGVAGVFLYGYRQASLGVAIIAGGLMAIEGYLVGFGRIVQYQSLVILTTTLALLCLLVYTKNGKGILVILAAGFFAVGTWAHYDAVLFLPAGLLLIANRVVKERREWRTLLLPIVAGGTLGLFLVGYFYFPFFQSSQAQGALFYVSGRIGSDQLFYNHLQSTFNRTFVYDSIYLLALIFGGLAAQIFFTWKQWSRMAAILSVGFMLVAVTTLFYPQWWEMGEHTYAWLVMSILLFGSLFAPHQTIAARAVWLWLAIPALFYLFFVALPLTHVYTAIPGAVLLAATGLVGTGTLLAEKSGTAGRTAAVMAVILFILGAIYTIMAFVNHSPEYLREYPASKSWLFWTPFGDDLPREGLFGFPYRAGWKTVGYLYDSGRLSGSYDSNEERDITDYYTRQTMRFDCATPDIYITAVNVQDEVPVRFDQIDAEFGPGGEIWVNNRLKMTIYLQDYNSRPRKMSDRMYTQEYDLGTTPEAVAEASPAVVGEPPAGFSPVDMQVGDFARLAGYHLDTTHAHPGGYLELLLLWEAQGPAGLDYQVFTHLHDGQEMIGQLDGQPVCNSAPTSRWQAGSFIVDPYRIPIRPDIASGNVPLTVGMYNLATLQRLPVLVAGELSPTDAIFLTEVEITDDG